MWNKNKYKIMQVILVALWQNVLETYELVNNPFVK